MKQRPHLLVLGLLSLLLAACSERGPLAMFKKLSPHEQYAAQLKSAGLDRSAMARRWLEQAEAGLRQAQDIRPPYQETGYFSAEKIPVAAFRLAAERGRILRITLATRPAAGFKLFTDLFLEGERVAATDSDRLSYEVKKTGTYVLRLQPELLVSGEYTLKISTGPSLDLPVAASGRPRIGSFWNDARDAGERKHEGLDIFAVKGSPAIAAADGRITRVTENNLGGKVVFMRPQGRDYSLYYAHLDLQTAREGQAVRTGDTLGLVGNTGNARTTPAHLHFGIYTGEGAIDPLPFIQPQDHQPPAVSAPLSALNGTRILTERTSFGPSGTLAPLTPVYVQAASGGQYRVRTPDGQTGLIAARGTREVRTIRTFELPRDAALYDAPDSSAARKVWLKAGTTLRSLGRFKELELVGLGELTGWLRP